ncbi:dGTPase [Aliidiomarina maris]|uniref:dGTPase n=1 Tax=Aliidiomarina maris TaxID=531312 RepID=A0A327X1B5_9GAMM|nr:dGTPase [Aliidiomarina maris]RAJ98395.1 dGTPase [Aliidiomarina maris]RUO24789.1 dGTPase [Aliidiomarina maris]
MADNDLDFSARLSLARPYPSDAPVKALNVAAFERELESDRGRIINSAAVRRLQQKTQVFPLERNAAVRSRLTHSLEVQQVGRFITRTLFELMPADTLGRAGLDGYQRGIESAVEMACLMHDIGNPPFGHFGEAAISRWFASHAAAFPGFQHAHPARDALLRELAQFEGNAQGIRIVTSLQRLNLTYMQTAAILKYTREATAPTPPHDQALSYLHKKPGYYVSEAPYVHRLWQQLQMQPGTRYPLAYLMEAADDISYCLADIEDGVDKGLLDVEKLCQLLTKQFSLSYPNDPEGEHFNQRSFAQIIDSAWRRYQREPINKNHEFFVSLRVQLTHPLVTHAAHAVVDNLGAVQAGTLNRALLEDDSPAHALVQSLKTVAREHIFCVPEVQTLELQGYRIITGLLDFYAPLLHLEKDQFSALLAGDQRQMLLESRLLQRLANKHVAAYQKLAEREHDDPVLWEQYARCRLIQDMVSGMTDQFALDEFHTLRA